MSKIEKMKAALAKLKRGSDPLQIQVELSEVELETRAITWEISKAQVEDERQKDLAEYQAAVDSTARAEAALVKAVNQVRDAWLPLVDKLARAEEIVAELERAEYVKNRVEEVPPALANVVAPAPVSAGRVVLVGGPNDGRSARQICGVSELIEMSRRKRLAIEF